MIHFKFKKENDTLFIFKSFFFNRWNIEFFFFFFAPKPI